MFETYTMYNVIITEIDNCCTFGFYYNYNIKNLVAQNNH
jgi:hypothetical protein